MYNDLKGKVAVKQYRGIGAAIVSRLVAEGMNVVINHHSDEKRLNALPMIK